MTIKLDDREFRKAMAVYAAGKAAVNGFTQNIALQYAGKGVRARGGPLACPPHPPPVWATWSRS